MGIPQGLFDMNVLMLWKEQCSQWPSSPGCHRLKWPPVFRITDCGRLSVATAFLMEKVVTPSERCSLLKESGAEDNKVPSAWRYREAHCPKIVNVVSIPYTSISNSLVGALFIESETPPAQVDGDASYGCLRELCNWPNLCHRNISVWDSVLYKHSITKPQRSLAHP